MALGDVFELVVRTSMQSQEILNVFFYEAVTVDATASDLANVFNLGPITGMRSIMSTGVTFSSITTKNLYNPADNGAVIITGTGSQTVGLSLPALNAYTYTFFPQTREVRPGGKRFAGVSEDNQNDGVIVGAAILTPLEDLRSTMLTILKDLATLLIDTYAPVIIKRIKEGIAPDFTYRLPTTQAEGTPVRLADIDFKPRVSSQVSRKTLV